MNFFEVAHELDAQAPQDGSEASSKAHRLRTCFPSDGIEMPLDAPVFSCNRWRPISPLVMQAVEYSRRGFMESEAGVKYLADLRAWNADQDRIKKEEDELASRDLVSLGPIGELLITMEDGDRLEFRVKGETNMLASVHAPDKSLGDLEIAALDEHWSERIRGTFGDGAYQIRHVRNDAIIAVKNFTIDPPEKNV